ncbi:protein translocase subunit SecD [Vibrio crassostreae]|uniref:protein translocase subunit SecD n=1 Tax=Vibrio crassostreae TaxID=246167 RepID=UPI001B308EB0|nr:protein translocase subunit SecD [Vibrio crassostreae]
MLKRISLIGLLMIPIYLAGSLLFPKYLPNNDLVAPISLGIDLKGGHRLILGVSDSDIERVSQDKVIEFVKFYNEVTVSHKDADSVVFSFKKKNDAVSEDARTTFASELPTLTLSQTDNGIVVTGLLSVKESELAQVIKKNIDIVSSRLNALGAADISVYRQGSNKVVVELPSDTDMGYTKKILTSTSKVGLYLESNDEDAVEIPYRGMTIKRMSTPFISGEGIEDAVAIIDSQTGQPSVTVRLDSKAGKSMSEVSSKNVGKPIITTIQERIKINGVRQEVERIASVANIGTVLDRNFVVNGMGAMEASEELALVLQSGSLKAPMEIISEQTVDARLGESNIKAGMEAFVVGMLLLFAYVIYVYRWKGVVACSTIVINASLILIALSSIGASFTLTGIAGVVLTMGVAIDANIIIFERAKELGGNIRQAFTDSFSTIIDANVTTMIAALILFNVGSIPLKGFALTLAVGIVTTVISSYFINKTIMLTILKSGEDK